MTIKGECDYCHKYFEKVGRKNRLKHIFCTRDCYNKYRKTKPQDLNCTCLRCDKKFHRKTSAINNGEGKYCSRNCKHNAQREGILIRGESYNDRHLLRQSSQYKSWRLAAKKRANNRCEECGKMDGEICECCGVKISLHVHHIKPFATHIALRFDPKNSKVLCPKCHRRK